MVQPTNKSVIGSNLREDSIKKREFTDFNNNDTKKNNPPASALLACPLTRAGLALLLHHFSAFFPPQLSPLLRSPATVRFRLHTEAASEQR